MSARSILNHRRKYYSEFGEDGLLLYIVKRIEELTPLDDFLSSLALGMVSMEAILLYLQKLATGEYSLKQIQNNFLS